jgi:hypothetical protein
MDEVWKDGREEGREGGRERRGRERKDNMINGWMDV